MSDFVWCDLFVRIHKLRCLDITKSWQHIYIYIYLLVIGKGVSFLKLPRFDAWTTVAMRIVECFHTRMGVPIVIKKLCSSWMSHNPCRFYRPLCVYSPISRPVHNKAKWATLTNNETRNGKTVEFYWSSLTNIWWTLRIDKSLTTTGSGWEIFWPNRFFTLLPDDNCSFYCIPEAQVQ